MKQTQLQWVKDELKGKGYVTRNEALGRYISRLGARIADLHAEGWDIKGEWVKTERGKDYRYTLLKAPKTLVARVIEQDGRFIEVHELV